jgi:branched-chain amino acid transport system permease protein
MPAAELAQYLIGGLVVGSIYGLVGIGYTGVYNVTRIVNFAQGDFAMVGAMTAITVLEGGLPLPLAVAVAIVAVGALAAAVERWAIRPGRADEVRGIIVTLGVGVTLQGLAVQLWGTDARPLPAFSGEAPLAFLGVTLPPQALWVLGVALVLMAGLHAFFRTTYLGKAFRACAVNPYAARLAGIDVRTMHVIAFVLSGTLGAVAGIIVAPIALTQYDSGITLGIKGFVACVIGGLGHPTGAAAGGLLLGVLEAFAAGLLSSGYKNAIAFVLLLGFLLLRPGGLLGELERVER